MSVGITLASHLQDLAFLSGVRRVVLNTLPKGRARGPRGGAESGTPTAPRLLPAPAPPPPPLGPTFTFPHFAPQEFNFTEQ